MSDAAAIKKKIDAEAAKVEKKLTAALATLEKADKSVGLVDQATK